MENDEKQDLLCSIRNKHIQRRIYAFWLKRLFFGCFWAKVNDTEKKNELLPSRQSADDFE